MTLDVARTYNPNKEALGHILQIPKKKRGKFVLFNDASRAQWFSYHWQLDVKLMVIVTYLFWGNPLSPHMLLLFPFYRNKTSRHTRWSQICFLTNDNYSNVSAVSWRPYLLKYRIDLFYLPDFLSIVTCIIRCPLVARHHLQYPCGS